MKHILLMAFVLYESIFPGHGKKFDPIDSAQDVKSQKSSNLRLITRFHSLGQFSYGGRVVSENPVMDFNFSYDRKQWGLQIFKAMDLRDHNTPINFTLAVVNKNFHFGHRLTITPSAGFILEQSNTLADHGSDVTLLVTTTFKISKAWTIDHSTLLGNLILTPEEKDWVNRFRLLFSKRHFDLTFSGWHNNKVFDASEYFTCGASAFYSRAKISEAVSINAGVSVLLMPYSNHQPEVPERNAFFFTLAVMLD